MRWLHLSDLHFTLDREGTNTSILRSSLPNYLQEKKIKVDYIFITGDLRESRCGDSEDLIEIIVNFCVEISEIVGVSVQNIILTPGNHDVDRSYERREAVIKKNKKYDTKIGNIKDISTLTNAFDFFDKVEKRLYAKKERESYIKTCRNGNPHRYVECSEAPFSVLSLNTELISTKNTANSKIVGSSYVLELATKEPKTPKIVIAHSSPEVLEHDERIKIREIFEQNNVLLYICGHKHGIRFDVINNIYYVVMGCNKCADGVTPGFAVGYWDENNKKITITAYNWEKDGWSKYTHFNKDSSDLDIYLSEKYNRVTKNKSNDINSETYNAHPVSVADTVNPYKEAVNNGLAFTNLFLIPSWQEDNEFDIGFISKLTNEKYETLKHKLLNSNREKEGLFNYTDGYFSLVDAKNAFEAILPQMTKQSLVKIKNFVNDVLPITSGHSLKLRNSISELIAFIANNSGITADKQMAEDIGNNCFWLITKIDIKKWKDIIPLIAEWTPHEFLKWLDEKLNNQEFRNSINSSIFADDTSRLNYYCSDIRALIRTIQALAWCPEHITDATCVLAKILSFSDKRNNDFSEIVDIYITWVRTTAANTEQKIQALTALSKDSLDICWKVVEQIPLQQSYFGSVPKPKYIKTIEVSEKTTDEEWIEWQTELRGFIFELAKKSDDYMLSLLSKIDGFEFGFAFDKVIDFINNNYNELFNESHKVAIYRILDGTISKHEFFCDAHWKMSESRLETLRKLREKFVPDDIIESNIRIFSYNNDFGKIKIETSDSNMRENAESLLEKRTELLNQIFDAEGFSGIIRLLERDNVGEANSLDTHGIAVAFAKTEKTVSESEIRHALSNKNESIFKFMCFYISEIQKYITDTWDWVDEFNLKEWSANEFAHFFMSLPFDRNSWNKVELHSQDKKETYWKSLYIRTLYNRNGISTEAEEREHEYVLENLIKYNNYELVLVYLVRCVERNLPVKKQIEILKNSELSEYMKRSRETAMIIRKFQEFSKEDVSIKKDIMRLEWKYLTILFANAVKPKIIAEKLVDDGKYFRKTVEKSYNEENREEAEKAINLLNHSTEYPKNTDGLFNEVRFFKWVTKILGGDDKNSDELSEKCRYYIGRIIYYMLQRNVGLWDNTKILGFLNESDKTLEGFKDAVLGLHRTSFGKSGSYSKEEIERQLEFSVCRKKQAKREGLRRLANTFTKIEDYCKRLLMI